MPFFVVFALSMFVILISGSFKKHKKRSEVLFFILLNIAALLALSDCDSLGNLFDAFQNLSIKGQYASAIFIVTSIYFGGGFYISSNGYDIDGEYIVDFPASSDYKITFEVPSVLPKSDKDLFVSCFDRFSTEIINDLKPVYEMPDEAIVWIERMIKYTVSGGKMNRGLALMAVQQELAAEEGRVLSNKERLQAAALGWGVEFLQAFFLVADDIMDSSVIRRGLPCWYRRPEVKLIAINDSFILETCVYKILKRYFGSEIYFAQLLDLFTEVTRQTEFGQLLDLTSQTMDGFIDLSRFTMERYRAIVKYKTAYYSFYLPVALGMITEGITDRDIYNKAREIVILIGEFFQIQDDYLDCYGDPDVIGKIGTDIQDNKCSWLVIQALERCNDRQKKVLELNYGVHNERKVATVKALYRELDLENVFKQYEEQNHKEMQQKISEVKGMPKGVFEFLLKKIYKRKL